MTFLALAFLCAASEKPLDGAVIVVDPGHGGQGYSRSYTGGTRGVGSKMTESELNLNVAVELERLLKESGATVHMTRRANHRLSREGSSKSDELHTRIDYFDTYNPHFFLSVHHNAGPAAASGHTTLYKHNAKDDTLYESLAREVNDALEGAVPGPKRKLIKGDYHILRETNIPGTITESGFMTNKAFDDLSTQDGYPKKEAEAIRKGAERYWAKHKESLVTLREKLSKERLVRPRDPRAFTAIELNPQFQAQIKKRLAKLAPDGKYDPAKVMEYAKEFGVKAEYDGKMIRLTGSTSRKDHDELIDLLVAMKFYAITNEIKLPTK